MKISNRNLGIIIVIAIIIIAGVVFLIFKNKSPESPAVNPTETPSSTESASPTGISAAYRAQVRSDFINDCSKVIGQGRSSECLCAADYLAAHYTDAELVTLYLNYHSTGKVPEEVKTALGSCPSK